MSMPKGSGKGSDYTLSLAGVNLADKSTKELIEMFNKILEEGIHGISFSPYMGMQGPGDTISEEQIIERMEIVKPYAQWFRSFSCTYGNQEIPRISHENGIKTMVGAWLGPDKEENEEECANLIEVAKAGHVDIAAVGNEVMLRGDLTEDEVIGYIRQVKEALPDIDVGYVDAYYEFAAYPRITDACDVILTNCYPFWEGCALEYSLLYMQKMYQHAQAAAPGKKVIISETGWPTQGTAFHGAVPGYENALKYFIMTYTWAAQDNIEIFYFSTFDEVWKIGHEGDVGAYWGLWDGDGVLKFQ